MIPIIYESTETNFTSNGLGRLRDCTKCIVTEERNGVYELEFEYPIDGANYDLIKPGRIVAVEHDDTNDVQPFDIYSYSRPLNGVVTFYGKHISYRQSKMTVYGKNINSLSDAFALLENAQPENPFTYESDLTGNGYMAAADGTPRSVRSMLGGVEGSILDTYGGEFEWDKWTVKLHSARGETRDFAIRYGVNMLSYQEESDYSGSCSAVVPYWTDNGAITIVGDMVTADENGYNNRVDCIPLDLTEKFQTQPTTSALETMAADWLRSKQPYLPAQTIKVDFVRLTDSDEYAKLVNLQKCKLCDTILVAFPTYKVKGRFKIVKTVYDVLQERFTEMELGTLSTTLAEALGISSDASGSGDASTDYVLSHGTSGNWTYEKYKSGVLRAWYDSGSTTVTLTTSSGNGWYRNPSAYTISIPSAVGCTGIKYVNIVTMTDLANMITSVVGASTSTLSYYVSHLGTISGYSARVRAEIVGTWT